jgi:hypothetical protein
VKAAAFIGTHVRCSTLRATEKIYIDRYTNVLRKLTGSFCRLSLAQPLRGIAAKGTAIGFTASLA